MNKLFLKFILYHYHSSYCSNI